MFNLGVGVDLENGLLNRAASLAEYVPVIFARDLSTAEHTKDVLEGLGIPTLIEYPSSNGLGLSLMSERIPVLVPEDMQDESSEVVAGLERGIISGFDEEDEDLDDDFFDDEELDEDDDYDDDIYDDDEELDEEDL